MVGTSQFYEDGKPKPCYTARVTVGGTEVPTVDTSLHDEPAIRTDIREDGPATLTRISDIYVPAVWRGENVFEALPLDRDSKLTVPVKVEMREPRGSPYERDWKTVHYGWLRKIGSAGEGRLLRLKVADYANIVNNTPVTKQWGNVAYRTVLDWGLGRLQEKDGFPDVQLGATSVVDSSGDASPEFGSNTPTSPISLEAISNAIGNATANTLTSVGFTATEGDTVATLFNWVAKQTDTDWWFEPSNEGLVLMFVSLQSTNRQWTAKVSGGDLLVRDNRALYSIDPINTVTTIGEQKNIANIEGNSGESISHLYVTARATHEKLLENSLGRRNEKVIRGSFSDVESAKSAAKKRLKEEIRSGGEGELVTDGQPNMIIGNYITSKPLCGENYDADVPSLDYGVRRVRHEVPATGRYTTTCSVSMYVDESEINVTGGFSEGKGDVMYSSSEVNLESNVPEISGAP